MKTAIFLSAILASALVASAARGTATPQLLDLSGTYDELGVLIHGDESLFPSRIRMQALLYLRFEPMSARTANREMIAILTQYQDLMLEITIRPPERKRGGFSYKVTPVDGLVVNQAGVGFPSQPEIKPRMGSFSFSLDSQNRLVVLVGMPVQKEMRTPGSATYAFLRRNTWQERPSPSSSRP